MRMALGMVYGVRGPEPDDILFWLLRGVSWAFIVLGIFAWCLLPLAGSVGSLVICVLLWIMAAFALVDGVTSSRDSHRRTNAKLLSIAQREGKLKETSELFEGLQQGAFVGRPARALGYELQAGTPLYESVRIHPRALPRTAPAYAAIGSLAGAEPQALDELSQPVDPALASASRSWCDYVAYLVAMVLTMGLLLAFYGMFIIPQFSEIFYEFGLPLPVMTQLFITSYPVGAVIAVFAVATLLALGFVAFLYLIDVRILHVVTDFLFRRSHIATVQRMIALGVEHRVELPRLLYALSVTYPVRALRNRLSAAYVAAEGGQSLPNVLQANRLLSTNELGLIETAERVGNVPWALRQLAFRRESLLATRMNVVIRIAYPFVVLSIAFLVAFIVVSLFIPLVKLVEGLS